MIHIKITKKICNYCNKTLQLNSNWHFENDNIFCSKFCRKIYKHENYKNDKYVNKNDKSISKNSLDYLNMINIIKML